MLSPSHRPRAPCLLRNPRLWPMAQGMSQTSHDRLLIIDFGSQVTQLIARRLRELNVYCEIHPFQNVTDDFLREFAPKAVIFSGGRGLPSMGPSPRRGPGRGTPSTKSS